MDIDDVEKGLDDVKTKLSNAKRAGEQLRKSVTTYFNELTTMQADHKELVDVVNNLDGNTGYGATVDEQVNQEKLSKYISLRAQRLAAYDSLNTLLGTITEF